MIKADVVVSWPTNNDYPMWRLMIREERARFNEIFIVFTKTHNKDNYQKFVMKSMAGDNITFIDSPEITGDQDWRNVAVNAALEKSKSPIVWFTEQDFLITDLSFWDKVSKMSMSNDIVAVNIGVRMHPCCIFAKRKTIDKTSKNFGIVLNKLDHFGIFQNDLEKLGVKIYLMADNVKAEEKSFFHFNGLSHNWHLLSQGETPNYEPERFLTYLEQCLKMGHERSIEMDLEFYKIAAFFITANRALKN